MYLIIRVVGLIRRSFGACESLLNSLRHTFVGAPAKQIADGFGWQAVHPLKLEHGSVPHPQRGLHFFPVHARSSHSSDPHYRSAKSDKAVVMGSQAALSDDSFGARLKSSLAGRELAWLSRETGIPTSTLSDYARGKVPRADKAVQIAVALGTSVEALLIGAPAPAPAPALSVADAEFVWVPRFDLWAFDAEGKPLELETIPIRRDWLYGVLRRTGGLWFADMPSDALPDVAREGETIVCEDPGPNLQEKGVYVFWRDGEVMVRRVSYSTGGYTLSADGVAPIDMPRRGQVPPDELLTPIARVLATYVVREV
jgi:transcriptional regulator with XRE-family HTH domain